MGESASTEWRHLTSPFSMDRIWIIRLWVMRELETVYNKPEPYTDEDIRYMDRLERILKITNENDNSNGRKD